MTDSVPVQKKDVLQRLEALEKQNRRLRRVWLLMPAVLAAGLFVRTEAQSRVYQAEEFQVIDSAGKTRAVLGWRSDGAVGLGFSDTNGKKVAWLDVTATNMTLALGGDDAKSRALIDVQAVGNATLILLDANKKPRGAMGLTAAGDTFLSLADAQGTQRVIQIVQASAPEAPVSMSMFDAAGKKIFQAPRATSEAKPAAEPKK